MTVVLGIVEFGVYSITCLIITILYLGVSPSANKTKVKDAFKKVMSANHPDRGGSPYIASKINEAKDFLEKHSR